MLKPFCDGCERQMTNAQAHAYYDHLNEKIGDETWPHGAKTNALFTESFCPLCRLGDLATFYEQKADLVQSLNTESDTRLKRHCKKFFTVKKSEPMVN
jgi:hypothetical protein